MGPKLEKPLMSRNEKSKQLCSNMNLHYKCFNSQGSLFSQHNRNKLKLKQPVVLLEAKMKIVLGF